MHYCTVCGRVMQRTAESGIVEFICFCGEKKAGSYSDAKTSGIEYGVAEGTEMYQLQIQYAKGDRVNALVHKQCICGIDYMMQLRFGDSETVIHKCTSCNHEVR
jgi:DNA-directed RNA polymerase subunit M/transcription elongation factor TFIIS